MGIKDEHEKRLNLIKKYNKPSYNRVVKLNSVSDRDLNRLPMGLNFILDSKDVYLFKHFDCEYFKFCEEVFAEKDCVDWTCASCLRNRYC